MFLTKEAVRIGLPGYADAIESAGAPPVAKLLEQFAQGGGELYVLPDLLRCAQARQRRARCHATLAGATPLWEFIGDGATVFSY